MKIFIAASWLRLGGGVTRSLLELFKNIDYQKHDVTLMLMDLDPQVLEYVPKEIKVIVTKDSFQTASSGTILKTTLKNGKLFTAFSYIKNLIDWKIYKNNYQHQKWIVKNMEKQPEEYDVAISYAMMNSIVNTYVIHNVKAKKKILWCHIDVALYNNHYIKGLEELYPKYDRINCVSEAALNSLKNKYPVLSDRLFVAYNFIDFSKIYEDTSVITDIEIPSNKIKLCTVGRITDQKGIDILVEVANKLNQSGIDFVWWVVGTRYADDFNAKIDKMISDYSIKDKVILLGEKNPPYAYMKACDIYVQPSRYEGFCLTTSEAKVFAHPTVVTDFSGAREQFTDGIDATITDPTVDSIFSAVNELICSEEKRKMYSENLKNNPKPLNFISFEDMIL